MVKKLMAKQKNQTENVFFNKNVFDLNQKHLLVFQAFLLLKKHEGNKWRNTKREIQVFVLFFSFGLSFNENVGDLCKKANRKLRALAQPTLYMNLQKKETYN